MNKFRQVIWLWLTSVLFLSFSILGCATTPESLSRIEKAQDGEVVEAVGMAPVTADLLATKKSSLADAQRVAVEKVVGVFVSGKTLVEKAVTIDQNILTKSTGYIKKYEVLEEWQEQGFYYTKIKAFVSYQKILDDLNKLAILESPTVGYPRVVILIRETILGDRRESTSTILSDTIAQGLIKQGYKVVNRSEAEIVITGEATAIPLTFQELSGLLSFRGTLNAKAEKTQTGEILGTISIQGSGVDITKEGAFQKTMTLLGEKAAKDFSELLLTVYTTRPSISLAVNGLTNFNELLKVRDTLARIEGVGEVFTRSFSSGIAKIEIRTISVTSTDIAKELTKRGWRVVSQTHDTLEINPK